MIKTKGMLEVAKTRRLKAMVIKAIRKEMGMILMMLAITMV